MITRACNCGGLITNEGCARCGRSNKSDHSRTPHQRGYGHDWQKVRKRFLKRHPLCHDCSERGRVTKAREVHHKQKITRRPELRLVAANLMGLCSPCHVARTARGE
jgi:5-methylcytosine-specific restriction protein A